MTAFLGAPDPEGRMPLDVGVPLVARVDVGLLAVTAAFVLALLPSAPEAAVTASALSMMVCVEMPKAKDSQELNALAWLLSSDGARRFRRPSTGIRLSILFTSASFRVNDVP